MKTLPLSEVKSKLSGLIEQVRARRIIDILAVGPRERIYEETLRLISKG